MSEAQPILDLLLAKVPWLVHVATCIGFARLALKPGANWIKSAITWAYERAITTSDTLDDHWIEVLVATPIYRQLAWLLDFLCSVKLPLAGDLFAKNTPL